MPRGTRNEVSAKKQKIKVLVVDDHPVVRKGLQLCLARQERLKIVGEAADGEDAWRQTQEMAPDVVLMDINLPRMNGLAVTELIRKERPKVKILVLSANSNREYVLRINKCRFDARFQWHEAVPPAWPLWIYSHERRLE